MKIILPTATDSLDGPFDSRFGRGKFFCLVDSETSEYQAHANPGVNATGGAGVQASQLVAELGAEVAISGDFGPNAYMTLNAAGVAMYLAPAGDALTGRQVLEAFQQGKLEKVSGPTGPGHHHK